MALFKFSLKHEDAIASHKSFYEGDFEVLEMERRSYFDIFPLNLVTSYVDLPGGNEWDGIISTDGKKIVMTESKWRDKSAHKKVYEFSLDDIEFMDASYLRLNILFNKPYKGLTMKKSGYLVKLLLMVCSLFIVVVLQSFIFKGNYASVYLDDNFGNADKFKSLLNL